MNESEIKSTVNSSTDAKNCSIKHLSFLQFVIAQKLTAISLCYINHRIFFTCAYFITL